MKKTPKKPRNYAATEATLINIRAMKKRIVQLEKSVSQLQRTMVRVLVGR